MLMVGVGLVLAVFGLAQGLMVRHPSSPIFLLIGVVGVALVIYGASRLSRRSHPTARRESRHEARLRHMREAETGRDPDA